MFCTIRIPSPYYSSAIEEQAKLWSKGVLVKPEWPRMERIHEVLLAFDEVDIRLCGRMTLRSPSVIGCRGWFISYISRSDCICLTSRRWCRVLSQCPVVHPTARGWENYIGWSGIRREQKEGAMFSSATLRSPLHAPVS